MDIGSIFLGWLLGMLSPVVVSRIKRKYSKNDLHTGIINELTNLQVRMTCTAHILGANYGKYDKEFVEWCIENIANHDGSLKEAVESLEKEVKLNDEEFSKLRKRLFSKDNVGHSLKKQSLSFSDLHLLELSLFSIELQNLLFELKARLSIYNDEVEKAEKYLYMTFDPSISDENHIIIKQQIVDKYKTIQNMIIKVVDQINKIKREQNI